MSSENQHIPSGYKPSPLGPIPEDWEVKRLGEVCTKITDGTHGTPKKQDFGVPYLTAIHVKDGAIDYNNCYFLNQEDHNEIYQRCDPEYGDVLMVNIGAGVGSVAMNKVEYEFSLKNVALLKPNKRILTGYFLETYLLSSKRKNLHKLLNGGAQPFWGLDDIAKIHILLPSLAEQNKFENVIRFWDIAIEKQTALVEKLTLRKRGLMQQLLTGKKRLNGFSGEWKIVELGDVLSYIQPTKYLVVSENYNDTYNTPVLTAGKTFILGYTNETIGVFNDLPAIIFDDFTTESKYVTFPFKAKSSAMKILKAHNSNLYFIFCAMQMIKYSIGGHERHWISKYSHLTLKVPSIEEQNAIASVLIDADKEIELANKKLARLQEQKKGLMQVLLTGKRRIKIN